MNNQFADARKIMAGALDDDDELYIGYQANVAMLLYDRYGIKNHKKRNNAADDMLRLIFDLKRDCVALCTAVEALEAK